MPSVFPVRLAAVLAVTFLAASCKSFDVEPVQVAILSVPTELTESGYVTSPSAFFIEGTGLALSSTEVGQEGCIDQPIRTSGNAAFDYLDAGESITARFGGPDATLARSVVAGRTTYNLADGLEMPFTPGAIISFTIPGAAGGFPARSVAGRTAEAFTASAITLPGSLTEDLALTWTPVPNAPGSAMFYSIRYSSTGSTQDREIACVFRDDGTGVIGSNVLTNFRAGSNRSGMAQRARITVNRSGQVITHLTSTFEFQLTLTDET
jgi:hypothetical protein